MTLIEMTITVFATGVALFLLTSWMSMMRQDSKRDLALRMLWDLDHALARYRRATGFYPVTRGAGSDIPEVIDLLDHEKTRPILDAFPRSLWRGRPRRHLVDPWGTRLRYYPPDSKDAKVRANGGRPIFESAGPDRLFGDGDLSASGDNLRSDDPGPQGFRIHDALRDALVEQEQPRGQESDQ